MHCFYWGPLEPKGAIGIEMWDKMVAGDALVFTVPGHPAYVLGH